jgi:chitinase
MSRSSRVSGLVGAALISIVAATVVVATPAQAAFTGATLLNKLSKTCLTVRGSASAAGTAVEITTCAGTPNQKFTTTSSGQIQVTIGSVTNCLDASSSGTANGTKLIIWPCHSGTNQRWTHNADNSLRGVASGRCVDINGSNTANGTGAVLWDCKNGGNGSQTWTPNGTPPVDPPPSTGLPKHALIGYLHSSFANGSGYVRMADVPAAWDIVNLAFGEPTSPTSGDIRFTLCPATECAGVETEAQFIAAIRAKRQAGKKVLLSIGGQNGQVQLTTTGARDKFVSSVGAIIDKYGLDGVDIDFEGHSLSLQTGDNDFKNPKSPVVVNLIAALKSLKAKYGANFVLTMAPETFFVQLGYQYYGSGPFGGQDPRAGAYLPVIYAMRNDLTVLHVQDYNSGPIMGLDNQYKTMGDAGFHIAMTDMLLAGFPVAGNTANAFPALREDQVAFGAPAAVSAGNGYVGPAGIQQAVNCIVRGSNCGGYTMRSGTNPNFRGLMTWSINWDRYYNWEFQNNHEPFLNALG